MSNEKKCLLCNTENVKYEPEFLEKRTHFSAPKLRELRIKWNEAIAKIHPILKLYVNNVNTYQVCDLHFRESDIKKSFETNGNIFRLPVSKWGLKIEALPLSHEELGREKHQKTNTNLPVARVNINREEPKEDMWKNENKEDNPEEIEFEISSVKLEEISQESIQTDESQEDELENDKMEETEKIPVIQKSQETEKNQEPEINLPSKEIQPEKDKIPEKEKSILVKNRPIRPDFRKKVEIKFSPYPILQSFQQGVQTKAPQMIQIKSGRNKVFVVPAGAQVIPFSPSSSISSISPSVTPLSMTNKSSPAMRVPIITHVTSLQSGSPVTKFIPVTTVCSKPIIPHPIIPVTKVPCGSQVPLVRTIPLVTKVNSGNSVAKITPAPGIRKETTVSTAPIVTPGNSVGQIAAVSGVTEGTSLSECLQVPAISGMTNVTPTGKAMLSPSSKTVQKVISPSLPPRMETENYDKDQLLCDLKRNPLPIGWAYTFTSEDKILFTQYCTNRRFPIFLRVESDMTAMISVGHLATNYIPYPLKLACYINVMNGLRKLENDKWCIGIGFSNNNHSDLCSVLAGRMNSRCKACATIRKNEQRNENEEIQRRQRKKPSKNLKNLIANLKRINERLEGKVCKMKLMVAHLKNKQCVDCLHDKFLKKTLAQTDSSSNTASKSD
ncbi:uncharacterized protein LOC117182292 [Belonocnema kinseyi]|uniref:uncharacterized protein LOC117182292 n=1 Tax=Belonocnema kinseyi TaxID=2817044 RepID=UPI00143DF471|nr:uncharacterized protein LOC117182292 [Belonocnema kinseyi]